MPSGGAQTWHVSVFDAVFAKRDCDGNRIPGGLVVGPMQHHTDVRIRDTDLLYTTSHNERCFEVVLGSNGAPR